MSHSCRKRIAGVTILISLPIGVLTVILGFRTGILSVPRILIFGLDGSRKIPDPYADVIFAGVILVYILVSTLVVALPVQILLDLLMRRKKT